MSSPFVSDAAILGGMGGCSKAGGAGVGLMATFAASSRPLSKAAQPYVEALASAPIKKLAHEEVDPSVTLCPYLREREQMSPPRAAWLLLPSWAVRALLDWALSVTTATEV